MAFNTVPLHGKVSRARKNGVNIAFSADISLNVKLDTAEQSSQGDNWKAFCAGMGEFDGTIKFYFVPGNTEQKALQDNIIAAGPGTVLTDVSIVPDGGTTANQFTGNIILTSFALTANMGAVVDVTYTYKGTGAPGFVTNGT